MMRVALARAYPHAQVLVARVFCVGAGYEGRGCELCSGGSRLGFDLSG